MQRWTLEPTFGEVFNPLALAVSSQGVVYVADTSLKNQHLLVADRSNHRLREIHIP